MNKIRKTEKRMQKKAEHKKGLASFVSSQKEAIFGIASLIIIAVVVVLIGRGLVVDEPVAQAPEVEEALPRHPLTGEVIDSELEELPQVFGVMVENAADAWPLSGLDEAFLVVEAPVEASIPRFIAFFSSDSDVDKIGPVRSARPYYVDWNDGLQAIYAHVGGSPEALELIADAYETMDLNQFWYDEYFYRENGTRFAPHNVFTSIESLIEAWDEVFDGDEPDYDTWQFADDAPVEGGKSVSIDWTDGTAYDVYWEYVNEANAYIRYQGEGIMMMEDGDTVEVNNIAVIATDIRVIDNEGRRSIVTVGQGDALIIQNGEAFLAQWKKEDHDDRLKFYTSDGYEISFNAGSTWIQVVSSLSQVEVE